LLLVMTHRPQVEPTWAASAPPQSIALERLSRTASRGVVQALLAGRAVPEPLVDRMLDRAEGIPLFLEEFASLLAEVDAPESSASGHGFANVAIPDSLQASLAARLDRIGPARRVAQLAAAFGRSFSLAQLKAMPDFREVDIEADLRELARKGLLGAAPGVHGTPADEHEFSHALIRDAAYQSMLREDRQAVHQRIAETLEVGFPDVAAARPELVAHHFTEAKARRRAVDYWFLAGQKAMERLANVETIEHLRRGLAMLDAVDAAERPMLELGFQTTLMPALCATRGYANLEVEQTFSRAHELCKQLGSIPALSAVLYGLWSYYLVRADLVRSRQLSKEMKQIADQTGDALQRMESELAAGLTSMYEGDLAAAADNFHRILAIWRPDGPQFFTAGEDIRASTKSWLGIVYWHQGDVDRAKDVAQESLYRARQVDQPISLAFALYFNAFLAHFCRDVQGVNALAAEGLQLCQEKKLFWGTLCVLQLGWAMTDDARGGDMAAGTAEMLKGLAGFRLAGARLTQTYYLAMIAQARLLAGNLVECERLLTEAIAAAEETGEQLWRSELLRLRGELALRLEAEGSVIDADEADPAEGLFRSALAHAQAIGAPSLALRAAMGLARCLGIRQRQAEALELLVAALAPIRSVAATPDIGQARGLLDALRHPQRRANA
jgi:predicted ATPase